MIGFFSRGIISLAFFTTPIMAFAQKSINYIAVELDSASHQIAVDYAQRNMPWEDAKLIAHHMTILHHTGLRVTPDDPLVGEKDYVLAWAMAHEGENITLVATEVGHSDRAFALRIAETSAPSRNRIKHVTLATNPTTGGSAVDSNYITEWKELPRPMMLSGKVTIYYK